MRNTNPTGSPSSIGRVSTFELVSLASSTTGLRGWRSPVSIAGIILAFCLILAGSAASQAARSHFGYTVQMSLDTQQSMGAQCLHG